MVRDMVSHRASWLYTDFGQQFHDCHSVVSTSSMFLTVLSSHSLLWLCLCPTMIPELLQLMPVYLTLCFCLGVAWEWIFGRKHGFIP